LFDKTFLEKANTNIVSESHLVELFSMRNVTP